jgi:hypothetical protein
MSSFMQLMFSVAGGLTLSGLVANLYRLVARKPQGRTETWSHFAVMVVAGPSVLLDNSTRSFLKKQCSRPAYAFALGLTVYWSFMLGAIMLVVVTYG